MQTLITAAALAVIAVASLLIHAAMARRIKATEDALRMATATLALIRKARSDASRKGAATKRMAKAEHANATRAAGAVAPSLQADAETQKWDA